jgi:hypothetical protein
VLVALLHYSEIEFFKKSVELMEKIEVQNLRRQIASPRFAGISFTIAVVGVLATLQLRPAQACPFCSAVSQTLRQEMQQSDAVAFAKIVAGTTTDSDAIFEIHSILKGDSLLSVGQQIRVNYFGKAKPDQYFMIMGVDPPDVLWSSPLPVSAAAMDYVTAVNALPLKDSLGRLKFYIKHLEHAESLIARDAYDEFASAPYPEIQQLKDKMDHDQLLKWIQDSSLPQDRKRLYLVMLGVCGSKEDCKLLETLLRSDDPNRRGGLDAMIACYATLKGEEGLSLIDELFLANKKSQYADTYSAIMALRFHGNEGGVIDRDRVLASMRLILERPELADLVIPDLARWEDWSQIDKLVSLFKSADEKSSWLRVPVINYLRACPLPEAEVQIAALKELDPAAFKRATSFFPIPKSAAPSSTDGTSVLPAKPLYQAVVSDADDQLRTGSQLAAARMFATAPRSTALAIVDAQGLAGSSPAAPVISSLPNQGFAVCVTSMVSVTLWLMMWLSISGAGNYGILTATILRFTPTRS